MSQRPTLFRTKRFAIEAATALVLALGLFALGFWVASIVLSSLPEDEGLRWVITDPSDPFAAKVKLGVVAALAPLVALIASSLHRLGARAHPGWRSTVIHLTVPIAAVAAGVAIQINGVHALAHVDQETFGVPYTVAVRDLLPGFTTKNLLAISTLVLWAAVFAAARARRKAAGR